MTLPNDSIIAVGVGVVLLGVLLGAAIAAYFLRRDVFDAVLSFLGGWSRVITAGIGAAAGVAVGLFLASLGRTPAKPEAEADKGTDARPSPSNVVNIHRVNVRETEERLNALNSQIDQNMANRDRLSLTDRVRRWRERTRSEFGGVDAADEHSDR